MITIFSNPRPFKGIFDSLQRNSIKSWLQLYPPCEIILFNDEENTTIKIAEEFGIKCITDVKTNEFHTPLLNNTFAQVQQIAKNEIIAYVNTDIILNNDFLFAINAIQERPFYMIGQRWNLNVAGSIDFASGDWQKDLKSQILKNGKIHSVTGMDYWVFNKTTQYNMPEFAVGRPGADSWLVYKNRIMHIPVIDATSMVTIIHQNHPHKSSIDQQYVLETEKNRKLCKYFFTIADANWKLTKDGLKKVKITPYNLYRYLVQTPELLPGRRIFWKPLRQVACMISFFHTGFKNLNVKLPIR